MAPITDHQLRYDLANELHARPFPSLDAPCTAVFLAIKQPANAVARDRSADRAHLVDLLDRFGAAHPPPDATHFYGQIGRFTLKWEQHTEFVTYTVFEESDRGNAFDPVAFDVFPNDWLDAAPGVRLTSALFHIAPRPDDDVVVKNLQDWFVPESLAVSRVLDDAAIIAGDFRIDPAGHMRFAIFADDDTGSRRIGRVVQRLCEIEMYKSASMLGLARVKQLGARMGALEADLSSMVGAMTDANVDADTTLQQLLTISAELENMIAKSTFRFGATGAYEAIVNQRIDVLREERFSGRQTFAEFMMRRFDPAMRTVKSTEARLQAMAGRAVRAAELLRTRVDVERSAQNQTLLASMDKRADLQLRLQKTVEGLSVVAISYYAVNLALYVLGPAGKSLDLSKVTLAAVTTPVVILLVWWLVRRIRQSMD
ncbi:hypothetical protein NIG5292_00628 [Nereida ignava]|uniref:Membrane-anchored protein n=1 Tax=Nereida ignava TaxID=282199 RepID=A0A0U1NJE1_9RHOB|nr:DUF3422 domain-containing protein [Nereida ignava]CRK74593.1 hypothetical protein NIG5292_00628 [Nereida ignava]SFJ17163.1 Uncharacterized membrane-anchored protein [Nereida ignava DSM 16309]